MAFDAVVLATPAYATQTPARRRGARRSPTGFPPLRGPPRRPFRSLSRASDAPVPSAGLRLHRPPRGRQKDQRGHLELVKWSFRAPPDRLLIRSFVGGSQHEELVSYEDEDLVAVVREELREIAGIAGEPLFSRVYRWAKSMPRYTVGHLDRVDAIDDARKTVCPGLWLIGCSFRGIGIGDCVRSGFEAAEEIADVLLRRAVQRKKRIRVSA